MSNRVPALIKYRKLIARLIADSGREMIIPAYKTDWRSKQRHKPSDLQTTDEDINEEDKERRAKRIKRRDGKVVRGI